jgi:hypothetical protein
MTSSCEDLGPLTIIGGPAKIAVKFLIQDLQNFDHGVTLPQSPIPNPQSPISDCSSFSLFNPMSSRPSNPVSCVG